MGILEALENNFCEHTSLSTAVEGVFLPIENNGRNHKTAFYYLNHD